MADALRKINYHMISSVIMSYWLLLWYCSSGQLLQNHKNCFNCQQLTCNITKGSFYYCMSTASTWSSFSGSVSSDQSLWWPIIFFG
jgi:hypothetical protein